MKQQIISGVYKPGQKLVVEDICAEFGVSRAPVMDAMRRLSSEWFVEIIPQVGCRVEKPDEEAYREFITIFGEMEGNVAALAAERRTEDQLLALSAVHEDLVTRTEVDDQTRRTNRLFHRIVLDMAHSNILARLCDQVWDFGDFIFMTIAREIPDERIIESWAAAQKGLLKAIRERNGNLAKLHMTVWLTGFIPRSPD